MKLYDVTEKDKDILMLDIFSLLEMDNVDDEKKEKYLTMISDLIYQYFLSEKVEKALTADQLNELMSKYPPDSEENVQDMLVEIAKISPDAPDLLVDAMIETKARLVMDHFTTKLQLYSDMAKKEEDPEKKKYYEENVQKYSHKLDLVHNSDWAKLLE